MASEEQIKEYQKEYYQANKDKLKEYHREYREKNKEKLNTNRKEYYQQNKEKEYANMKKYVENNRERMNEYLRRYQKNYIESHPEVKQYRQDMNKEYNKQTRSSAHNHRQLWTREEVDILIELKHRNVVGKDIAQRLGRTLKSVHGMEYKIRKSGHPFTGNPVDI